LQCNCIWNGGPGAAKSLILKGFLFKKNHIFLKKDSFIINGLATKKAAKKRRIRL